MNRYISGLLMLSMAACAAEEGGTSPSVTEEIGGTVATCDYPQAFGNAAHTGNACAAGPRGLQIVKQIVQDADADAEFNDFGFLSVHESPPLTSGDYLIVPSKEGYVDPFDRSPERWFVQGWKWVCAAGQVAPCVTKPGSTLQHIYDVRTGWQPVDSIVGSIGSYTNGYVQGFYPAISGSSLYVPAPSGKVARVNLATGATVATIDPFAGTSFSGDPRVISAGGISVDGSGNALYNVTAFPATGSNKGQQPRGSWLVKVTPSNTATAQPWSAIATAAVGIPQLTDQCIRPFFLFGRSPTGPNDHSNTASCGTPRPPLNATPTVGPNGHIYVISMNNQEYASEFIVELDPATLTPIRAMDTRNRMFYGCGGRLDITAGDCPVITANGTVNLGFDPDYNTPVPFTGADIMDNNITAAPNGDLALGGYDNGFSFGGDYDARGAIQIFGSTGTFKAQNDDFGWEVTPTVFGNATSFSYLQDRNLYSLLDISVAKYSPTEALQATGAGAVDPNSAWVDFLDAHVLFDADGRYYGVNADGHLYAFDSAGHQVDSVEFTNADGSVRSIETLSGYGARDAAGRIIVSYAGSVYIISGTGGAGVIRPLHTPTAAQKAGLKAKAQRAASTPPARLAL